MGRMKDEQLRRDEEFMRHVCPDCMGSGYLDHHDGENSGQVTCFLCGGSGVKPKGLI